MPRRSILSEDEPTGINLSSMIDCIFILLIFFIVTTVFVEEKGLQVSKPDAAATSPQDENENVVIEITNEYGHRGFDHSLLKEDRGQVELLNLCRANAPGFLLSTSGTGNGKVADDVGAASDILMIHLNNVPTTLYGERVRALRKFGKPIVCNEDEKVAAAGVAAAEADPLRRFLAIGRIHHADGERRDRGEVHVSRRQHRLSVGKSLNRPALALSQLLHRHIDVQVRHTEFRLIAQSGGIELGIARTD